MASSVSEKTDDVGTQVGVELTVGKVVAVEELHKLGLFGEVEHDVEHNELGRSHHCRPAEVHLQNLGRVHPPEVGVLVGTVNNILQVVKVLLVLDVLRKVHILVVLQSQHEKSGIVASLQGGNGDHPDEGGQGLGGAQKVRQLLVATDLCF